MLYCPSGFWGRCVIAGAIVPIPPGPPDTQPCHRELCSLQGSSAHRAGYGLLTFPDVFGGERVCPLFLCPSSRSFYSWFLRLWLTHVKLHLNSLAPEDLRVHSPHCGALLLFLCNTLFRNLQHECCYWGTPSHLPIIPEAPGVCQRLAGTQTSGRELGNRTTVLSACSEGEQCMTWSGRRGVDEAHSILGLYLTHLSKEILISRALVQKEQDMTGMLWNHPGY